MIVIVEGPDGAGKSTLAKELAQRYRLQYYHEGPPPRHIAPLEYYASVLDSYRFKDVVLDRFALGERVYGPIFRHEDRLDAASWRVFERLLTAVGAVQILALPPYDVCFKTWASGRPEMIRDAPTFRATYEKFYQLRGGQHVFNFDEPGATDHVCRVVKTLSTPPLPTGVVGSPTAEYLFVGARGSNPKAMFDLPFFWPTGSSGYLTNALDAAGYQENEIVMVNAYRHTGQAFTIPKTFKTVIALGEQAINECVRQKVPFRATFHPQYVKRFRSNTFDRYVEVLRSYRHGDSSQ